jgi:hypothetical protein
MHLCGMGDGGVRPLATAIVARTLAGLSVSTCAIVRFSHKYVSSRPLENYLVSYLGIAFHLRRTVESTLQAARLQELYGHKTQIARSSSNLSINGAVIQKRERPE